MRFAIIGYGGMGSYHARYIKEHQLGKVVAAYDIDALRQNAAAEDGYKAYKTEGELWQDADFFDAAIVATPNDIHAYYCEKLAKVNKHVICEKPATNTAEEFVAMKSFSEKYNTVLEVHQNRRRDYDFLLAKHIASSGIIGKVYKVESNVVGANGIPGGWRKLIKHGGGMMLDWGVHLIDQACIFTNSSTKIKNLYSQYSYILGFEVEDGCSLNLEFENGLNYNIIIDTNSFVHRPRWLIYGTEGSAEITDWENNGKIVVKKDYTEKLVGIKAGNGFTKTMAARPKTGTEIFDLPALKHDEGEFYKNFILACEKKAEQIVKNNEVLRVLKIMDAAKKSALQNKVLTNIKI